MTISATPEVGVGIDGGGYEPGNMPLNGTERHLQQLLLQMQDDKNKKIKWVYFYFTKSIFRFSFSRKKNVYWCCLPRWGYSSFWLPIFCLIYKINTFIGYAIHIPFLLSLYGIKKISVIHDVGFIDYPKDYVNAKHLKSIFFKSLKRAHLFICFSQFVRNRLHAMTKKTVFYVAPGVEHITHKKPVFEKDLGKYVLYVGRLAPNKNIETLLNYYDMFRRHYNSEIKLLLVGKDDGFFEKIIKNDMYKKNVDAIRSIGLLSDSKLVGVYKKALCMLNCSLTEGLCFPVIEALSIGLPVFVLDKNLYFEYKNYFSNIYLIQELIFFGGIRKKAKKKFIEKYSWMKYYNEIKSICTK